MRPESGPNAWLPAIVLLGLGLPSPGPLHRLHAQEDFSTRAPADSVVIGGRADTQFNTTSVDGEPGSEFLLRRARLWASARLNHVFDGVASLEFTDGSAQARYLFLRAWLHPAFRVTAGQFKRSFDMFSLTSSSLMLPIERTGIIRGVDGCSGIGNVCSYSRFSEQLQYGAVDTGLMIEGDGTGPLGPMYYRAAVTNGEGGNVRDTNGSKSVSAHVSLRPTRALEIGGGVSSHDYTDELVDGNRHAWAWGVDAQWGSPTSGPRVKGALMAGDNWKVQSPQGDEAPFSAWQGVAAYRWPLASVSALEAVEWMARLTGGDPDRNTGLDGGHLWSTGINLWITERSRIATGVDVWRPEAGPSAWSLKTQTQFFF